MKDAQIALVLRTRAILNAFQKLTRACFSQIALETYTNQIQIHQFQKKHEYVNIHTPPPINALVTALQTSVHSNEKR